MKSLLFRTLAAAAALLSISACERDITRVPCGQGVPIPSEQSIYIVRANLKAGEECAWPVLIPEKATNNATVPIDVVLDVRYRLEEEPEEGDGLDGIQTSLDGVEQRELGWTARTVLRTGEHVLRVRADRDVDLHITFLSLGEVATDINPKFSLEWTQSVVTGASDVVGLGTLMAQLSNDSHGGRLFADMLSRFETTEHSSRPGPTALLNHLKAVHGDDPSLWEMQQLPFRVVSVQNRIDLRDADTCGQLRVVFTSTSEEFAKEFRMAFLYKQVPDDRDYSPRGVLNCSSTALKWIRFTDAVTLDALLETLTEALNRNRFLRIQTSERIAEEPTQEFREWVLTPNSDSTAAQLLPLVLTNRPLFQTVDVPRVNADGEARTRFLDYVSQNAAALNARTAVIPEEFLALSAGAVSSDWTHLDLSGLPAETLTEFPDLRKRIEVVGCLGCHGTRSVPAPENEQSFVHSAEGQSSGFLADEMGFREQLLLTLAGGDNLFPVYGPLNPGSLPP